MLLQEDRLGHPFEELGIAAFTSQQIWIAIPTSVKNGMATPTAEEMIMAASLNKETKMGMSIPALEDVEITTTRRHEEFHIQRG